MTDLNDRVLVVGGGAIGAACAYYLRQTGRSVTIIDQGGFGRGCSHGKCAYVWRQSARLAAKGWHVAVDGD